MKFSKVFTLLISFIFSIGIMTIPTFADIDETKAIFYVEDVSGEAGSEITVTVRGSGMFALFGLELTYDTSCLTYLEDSFTGIDSSIGQLSTDKPGKITFEKIETETIALDNSVVATLKFTAKSDLGVNYSEETKINVSAMVQDLGEEETEDNLYNQYGNCFTATDGLSAEFSEGTVTINKEVTSDVMPSEVTLTYNTDSNGVINAFGITNAKVVTISLAKNKINPSNKSIKVGDVVLFYAPERSLGTTDVFVGILRGTTEHTVAETVAATATIEDTASVNLYYGKISNPSYNGSVLSADVARALAMLKGGASGNDYTDAQRLAADVVGGGSIQSAHVARILASLKTSSKSGFNILSN